MNKQEQETLLQTIKARLERNELNMVMAIPDENGLWSIVINNDAGLIKYFEPSSGIIGVDKYGNILSDEVNS